MEVFGTFGLATFIGYVKYFMPSKEGFLQAFSVGTCLTCMILICGSTSGACLNPAVGIGQTVFMHLFLKFPLTKLWIYTAAPLTGGILAGAWLNLNELLYNPLTKDDDDKIQPLHTDALASMQKDINEVFKRNRLTSAPIPQNNESMDSAVDNQLIQPNTPAEFEKLGTIDTNKKEPIQP